MTGRARDTARRVGRPAAVNKRRNYVRSTVPVRAHLATSSRHSKDVGEPATDAPLRTSTADICVRRDRIVRLVARPSERKHTVEEAAENVALLADIAAGGRLLLLVDLRLGGPTPRAPRKIYAEGMKRIAKAIAFIVESSFSRINANLFMKLARLEIPVRAFTSTDAAVEWLEKSQE